MSPGCENENENNVEELNIHQLDDINLDEYSDLLDLEIPLKIDETDGLDEFPGRLVIDTIELQNFKSYYDYKKIGPLSKVSLFLFIIFYKNIIGSFMYHWFKW